MIADHNANEEFMTEAKERMLDRLSNPDGKGPGRYGNMPYGRSPGPGDEEGAGPYPPGLDPNDPEVWVDRVERLKERLGGRSGKDSVMNSELLGTVVKTLLRLLLEARPVPSLFRKGLR